MPTPVTIPEGADAATIDALLGMAGYGAINSAGGGYSYFGSLENITNTIAGNIANPPLINVAYGGPEDRPPAVDFDTRPPPTTAPPTTAPPTTAPPTLPPPTLPPPTTAPPGEPVIPRPPPIEGTVEDFGMAPGSGRLDSDMGSFPPQRPSTRRAPRIYEGVLEEPPPWWARVGARVILGPYGTVAGQIIEAGMPEILGSGELPFPPIPSVEIPAPTVDLTWPTVPLPSIPAPELARPSVPDVIVVTAPAPDAKSATGSMPLPSSTPTLPANSALPNWTKIIGAIIGARAISKYRPISRGFSPLSAVDPVSQILPTDPQILPTDPLTPPRPMPGTDPLTPLQPIGLPSTQALTGGVPNGLLPKQTTDEQRCRCKKCEDKKKKKRRRSPSSTVAKVHPFERRMSTYSLKNLKRGILK